MAKILFMKYDFRKMKLLYLASIVLFAPLGYVMAYSTENILSAYSYMLLISTIVPTSLFTYEQRADCGFDLMLPAKEGDRIAGRYLISAVTIIYEFLLTKTTQAVWFDISVIFKFFVGGILICMSIELCILYIIGRGINPQVRSVMIMLPNMIIWGIASAAINIFSDKLSSAKGIFSNFEMLGNIVLIVSLIFYIASMYLSTYIVKKKDFR
jgi:predicted membrane protein